MGKSIAKARLCQRGKGLYLTTFDLPLLNPLPLLKHSHALLMPLPMQASCLSSLHSQHHRALGNHRLCHRLSSSCLALLASLPHRPSSLVCHTGCHLLHSITKLHALRQYSAANPQDPASLLGARPRTSLSMLHRLVTQIRTSLRSFAGTCSSALLFSFSLLLFYRSDLLSASPPELPPEPLLSVSVSTRSTLQ